MFKSKVYKPASLSTDSFLILIKAISFLFSIGFSTSIKAQLISKTGQPNGLKELNAQLYVRFNTYDYEKFNRIKSSSRFYLKKQKTTVNYQNSEWEIFTSTMPVEGDSRSLYYMIKLKCIKGRLNQASLSVDIDIENWSITNYVLLPAVAYNGNRYPSRKLRYSPKLYEVQDIGLNIPIILSDIPKLNETNGISRIQERSGSMSSPSIGFSSVFHKKGMWLFTEQYNELGDYGMEIEENRSRTKATISLTSPLVRELYAYRICDAHFPSLDIPANFKPGDSVSFKFRIIPFDAYNQQSIFDTYALIRKRWNHDTTAINTLSYEASMHLLEQKFNQSNWVNEYGYYSVGMRENFLQDWQIGWTGGMISTYPLLFSGDSTTKTRVIRNFDWLFKGGISPSGFFYDAGRNGSEWITGDIRKPQSKNWHLIRKSGDAVWYILKQFMLMEKMGIPVKKEWKDGNRKVCDAMVRLWNKYHQIGQFVDAITGDIIVGGSSSGGIIPAGLTLAATYYQNPIYLQTAKEIASYYNVFFIMKGISCGGPGDALQNFDSESSFALVESYTTLFEHTKDSSFLKMAENAAKQFSTWVVSYNYKFSDTSSFGKANIKTRGSVYANTQNKHAAPGICTASGLALLKLYRFTGNYFYLDLLYDIAHNITQYLPHATRPLGNAPAGWVSERINMSDWEGVENIGYVLPISTWAETSLMLTTIEIPGLYVQPATSTWRAFDNVEVRMIKNEKNTLVLSITNNSLTDATVTVMEDNSLAIDLGENYLYGCKKVTLKKGESKYLTFIK